MNLAGKANLTGELELASERVPVQTDPRTRAGRLEKLQTLHEATYDRRVNPDGTVRIRLHLSMGDVIAENGKDTEEALTRLEGKLRVLYPDVYRDKTGEAE